LQNFRNYDCIFTWSESVVWNYLAPAILCSFIWKIPLHLHLLDEGPGLGTTYDITSGNDSILCTLCEEETWMLSCQGSQIL